MNPVSTCPAPVAVTPPVYDASESVLSLDLLIRIAAAKNSAIKK